jgi:hypothetical protein
MGRLSGFKYREWRAGCAPWNGPLTALVPGATRCDVMPRQTAKSRCPITPATSLKALSGRSSARQA